MAPYRISSATVVAAVEPDDAAVPFPVALAVLSGSLRPVNSAALTAFAETLF